MIAVLISMSPEEHDQLDRDLNAAYGSETSDEDFDGMGGCCCCCFMPIFFIGLIVYLGYTLPMEGD